MTKRWRFFHAPPEMSTEEAIKSVQRCTEGRYGAFVDLQKVDAQGNGGVIRSADRIRYLEEAAAAKAQGDDQLALELLSSASAAALLGRYNEARGYTNRGRKHGSKNRIDPVADAVAWGFAEAKRVGRVDGYALALRAMDAMGIHPKSADDLRRMQNRIGGRINKELRRVGLLSKSSSRT